MLFTTEARLERLRADRRALHRIPELGNELPETRAYIRRALEEMGADEIKPCSDGIKAVFRAKGAQRPAIAFRADMDALPIGEMTGLPFASEHEGMMHACGHDGHMATLLEFGRYVSGIKDALTRDVVLLFQPAEENIGGARRMIEAGALEDPYVEEVYGMHVWPNVERGRIGLASGAVMSGVTNFNITVKGRSCHGAAPHLGNDPVCAAANAIVSLQSALMRTEDPADPVVFTVGSIQGGTVHNIVPDEVKMLCTARAYSDRAMEIIERTARAAFAGADAMYGTETEFFIPVHYRPVINDAGCTERLIKLAGERYTPFKPVSVSEDFSEYLFDRKGTFFFCGVGGDQPLHSCRFFFDEKELLPGLEMFEKILGEAD